MTENEVHILVANPQVDETDNLIRYFAAMGYKGVAVTEVEKIQDTLRSNRFALAFIDCEFLSELGEDLIEWSEQASADVVVMSSTPTVESVVNVLRMGVFDCLIRPFDLLELSRVVARVLERQGRKRSQTVCTNTDESYSLTLSQREEVAS